jgi:hypothetical protein
MSERRVGLDLGAPGTPSPGTGSPGTGSQPREEADPGQAEMFRRKLAEGEQASAHGAGTQPLARPFDLFGTGAPPPDPKGAEAAERRARVIEETVSRLLVSGGSGAGDPEVRIRMKNDLLPGAELRLVERAGRLEVDFVATDPESAAWLAAQAGTLAAEISRRLRREVRVSVRKDDYDTEPVAESNASEPRPALDGPSVLFAHRMVDENGREGGES